MMGMFVRPLSLRFDEETRHLLYLRIPGYLHTFFSCRGRVHMADYVRILAAVPVLTSQKGVCYCSRHS